MRQPSLRGSKNQLAAAVFTAALGLGTVASSWAGDTRSSAFFKMASRTFNGQKRCMSTLIVLGYRLHEQGREKEAYDSKILELKL